ncbi:hypothetical protein BCR44DRAFT_1265223 [Catenaria anguillulae PL171]|uniref:Uncharacterized protein n=1 Tax=Catenaria anguillulae PL171 TaxID=765915 RepID=A0A1Y2HCQ6_9FUNG|nr:hypothetical protein BCR44DRAFT_1265223 [Catenaria anguillulae PL171]
MAVCPNVHASGGCGTDGPAGLDCRALLMAVQRLDVELALKYLYPMPEEQALGYGIGTDGSEYMISWALLTLLHMLETAPLDQARSEPESSRIGLLLQAILEHPLLPSLSWVFTLSFFKSARRVLSAVSQSDSALLESRRQSHPPAARSRILLDLIRSGALSQSATSLFLLEQEQSFSSDPMPALSRIFLYLATLCRNPTTLSHILPYLTRPSAPPNLNSLFSHVPLTWALVTALATHHPTDPERFITHMLTHLDMHSHQGLAFHVSVRAIARGNHDAVDQLVVGIHDAQLLKSLLLPPFPHGTPPSMQMANAVVLTRWLHLTCAELAEMQAKGEPLMVQAVRKGTAGKKRVDYLELLQVEKWVKEYGEALEREGERGQARAGELDAAWEPVKAMMDEMTRASRRKSIGSKKEGRRGVNEGGCICQ